jgi:acylphosphatase
MEKKHLTLKITGRVQGIFFRESVKIVADRLGIKGFARNEADGGVTIEVEGNEPAMAEFTAWCRHGSKSARVESVKITESPAQNFKDFAVL